MIVPFQKNIFVWFFIVFTIIFYILTNINQRFNLSDFRVYCRAAENFVESEPVYHPEKEMGTAIYKYSPFALFFFIPFTLLPTFLAKTLYFLIIAACILYTMLLLEKFLKQYLFKFPTLNSSSLILFLTFLVVVVHFHRELELGNVNLILLLVLLWALYFSLSDRQLTAGWLIGIAILFKPYFIALLPLLLLRKKWKILGTVTTTIIVGLLIPSLIAGFEGNISLHSQWFQTMTAHNDSLRLIDNPNTIHSWLYRFGMKSLFPMVTASYSYGIILIIALLFLIWIVQNHRVEKLNKKNREKLAEQNFIFEYFLILAVIPNITFTDTEHFLLSLPIIMFLIIYFAHTNFKNNYLFYFALLAFFLYGSNWYDVWGDSISVWMQKAGLLGLGNMLILLVAKKQFILFCLINSSETQVKNSIA